MDINEYQNYVKEGSNPVYTKQLALIGLLGEIGEISDVIKKEAIYDDMSKFVDKYGMTVEEKIKDEASDVLWQYINLINQYNLSIQDVIDYNVEKLNKRHGGAGKTAKDGGGNR